MTTKYHGALRSRLIKGGKIAVIFSQDQARSYLQGCSTEGAQVRVDYAIAQALEAVLPKDGEGDK